ncbi:MAG: UDP-N-acetylmuramoyl-L-alanine--D-glutamate ligase [Candidatus Spechtbacteria bacterium SB0662_bin_43]|uniref:UDP-N-acetylmuramoylalanine--D-glutamate ligase n=1 Tax=Candidatus Spechtbacteria bacterium SB0662_bin_43 TaxID=2604897 RepID=A0A845DBK5_9BACT|nr:UDP-N-acetylmuramoyl-L-alanine--D-glutamate ligase [Candidatus Spechtbacteria bacterium SB0662_bin_43]
MDLKNKTVVIMGLGLAGGGVEDALFCLRNGAIVIVTDTKEAHDLSRSLDALKGHTVTLHLGGHVRKDFEAADLIIRNPAIPDTSPFLAIAREHNVPIEMGSGLFARAADMGKVIGVTGTKGKSTTTALIHCALQTKYPDAYKGGDVDGSPLKFLDHNRRGVWGVIELSSWRLEGMAPHKKSPHIAVITSIAQDHLNRYDSYDSYKAAKKIIVQFQSAHDFAILNHESEYLRSIAPRIASNILWFSGKQKPVSEFGKVGWYHEDGVLYGDKEQVAYKDIRCKAVHHPSNIAATLTVASLFDISLEDSLSAIQSFPGLFGRLQLVRTIQGIQWYNDTAATNPYAVQQSIDAIGTSNLAVIVGGEDKDLDFADLAKALKRVPFVFILPGSASEKIHRENTKYNAVLVPVATVHEAVQKAYECSPRAVLFSPGAASFNMFKNEFDRGEEFIRCVTSLAYDVENLE